MFGCDFPLTYTQAKLSVHGQYCTACAPATTDKEIAGNSAVQFWASTDML